MVNFVQTHSGKRVDLLDPQPETIDIRDIAFALSNLCRFNGQVKFYSVAEHCVRCCDAVPPNLDPVMRLYVLLHDAAEAYIGDIVRPLKQHMSDIKAIEDKFMEVIHKRFGLTDRINQGYKATLFVVDDAILATEMKAFYGDISEFGLRGRPLKDVRFDHWKPEIGYKKFLEAYEQNKILTDNREKEWADKL